MENNIFNNLGELLSLIKYPSFSEKSIKLFKNGQYTFLVDRRLTKTKLKYIFEKMFNVKIMGINTTILSRKIRRVKRFIGLRPHYKKVWITLQKGQTLTNLFN